MPIRIKAQERVSPRRIPRVVDEAAVIDLAKALWRAYVRAQPRAEHRDYCLDWEALKARDPETVVGMIGVAKAVLARSKAGAGKRGEGEKRTKARK